MAILLREVNHMATAPIDLKYNLSQLRPAGESIFEYAPGIHAELTRILQKYDWDTRCGTKAEPLARSILASLEVEAEKHSRKGRHE